MNLARRVVEIDFLAQRERLDLLGYRRQHQRALQPAARIVLVQCVGQRDAERGDDGLIVTACALGHLPHGAVDETTLGRGDLLIRGLEHIVVSQQHRTVYMPRVG